MAKEKTVGYVILVRALVALGVLILCGVKEVPSSTPGVTLFRTGVDTILPIIMGMMFVTAGLVLGALGIHNFISENLETRRGQGVGGDTVWDRARILYQFCL